MLAKRFYIKKSLVREEEDEYNEFKGHRSIGIEDLPPWCFQPNSNRRTRKPASRTLNAFLNSGRGGTLYLGIIDEGVIKGFYLTEYQKDHIIVAIKDLFSRYRPIVEEDKYEILFVPILEKHEHLEDVLNKINKDKQTHSVEQQLKSHLLQTYDFCWCDKDLARRIDEDMRPRDYVVEIKIKRQKTCFKYFNDGSFKADLPITYQNEEGICFFRTSASCKEYTLQSCQELAIQQLRDIYDPIISAMHNELDTLQKSNELKTRCMEYIDTTYVESEVNRKEYTDQNVCKEIKDYLEQSGMRAPSPQQQQDDVDGVGDDSNDGDTGESIINNMCKELGIVLEEGTLFKTKCNQIETRMGTSGNQDVQ